MANDIPNPPEETLAEDQNNTQLESGTYEVI